MDLLFDSTKGAGLNCFRMGESWLLEDQNGTWHWKQSVYDTGEIWVAKEAKKRNPAVAFWSAPWTPPLWMKTVPAMGNGVLQTQYYQRYADYKSRFIRDMRDKEGIAMMANSVQNEPHACCHGYGSCYYSPENIRDFVRTNLGPTLKRDGLTSTTIMIPESNYPQPEWAQATLNDTAASKYAGIFGWHQYADGNKPPLLNVPGKESWATEVSNLGGPWNGYGDTTWFGALFVHDQIFDAMANKDANAWLYYLFAGDGMGGILALSGNGNYSPSAKRLWWVAHYSKFVKPGWVRIGTSVKQVGDGAKITAFKDPASGRFAIVVGNHGYSSPGNSITVTCDGFTPLKVSAYLTPGENQNAHLQGPTDVPIVNGKFTYLVPNVSIATLVGETQAVGVERVIARHSPAHSYAMRVACGLRLIMDQAAPGEAELIDSQGRIRGRWILAANETQTLQTAYPIGVGVHFLRVRPLAGARTRTLVLH